jgi:hypothetical protein
MTSLLLVIVAGIVLVGVVVSLWRFWVDYAHITPEEADYERGMATLNDDQANRISDDQLTRPIDTDTGWAIMVRRGQRPNRRRDTRPRRRR